MSTLGSGTRMRNQLVSTLHTHVRTHVHVVSFPDPHVLPPERARVWYILEGECTAFLASGSELTAAE